MKRLIGLFSQLGLTINRNESIRMQGLSGNSYSNAKQGIIRANTKKD